MKSIKLIQEKNNSRTFTKDTPLIIMCFLPVNIGGITIDKLSIQY